MKRTAILISLVLLSAWSASAAVPSSTQQPTQQQYPWTREEVTAFNTFFRQPDVAKKIQSLEDFVAKFPQSALVPMAQRFLVFLYLQKPDLNKAFEIAEAYFHSTHEKYAEAFKLLFGQQIEKAGGKLPTSPMEDFQMLATLAESANRVARSGKTDLDEQALKYTERALALAQAGSAPPTMGSAIWEQNKNTIMATLYQTIGLIKFNHQAYDEALAALTKAGQLQGSDPTTFYLQGEALRLSQYAEERKKIEEMQKQFNDLTEQLGQFNQQLAEINKELEDLSKKPQTRKVKERIQELQQQGEEINQKAAELLAPYKLTSKALETLASEGVAQEIVEKLRPLEGQEFSTKDDFLAAVKAVIEEEQLKPHEQIILKYANRLEQLQEQMDEQRARIDQIVDQMIQAYARAVALSDKVPQLKQTARQRLETYWKYRHNNSLEGLDELIQKLKA
ncbi:MAG: hypothetical protein D6723_14280 [Acidobacteria bacterium]|nr:MAG: hypothetical protein D6723_14280 [Acidobacteriota bacterium]